MRVICIENSIVIDTNREDCGTIATHKGSVYNVIGSVEGEVLRNKYGFNFAPGPWYEFLELKGLHHHIRFLEIPEDDIEVEKEEYKLESRLN